MQRAVAQRDRELVITHVNESSLKLAIEMSMAEAEGVGAIEVPPRACEVSAIAVLLRSGGAACQPPCVP